mmetsp:Transcript_2971/g.8985  ORF Transcript_2971/g.8985 Transcript_2971/m.8985 type:complete len:220 (+) Transcript_2971:528-1187(+)
MAEGARLSPLRQSSRSAASAATVASASASSLRRDACGPTATARSSRRQRRPSVHCSARPWCSRTPRWRTPLASSSSSSRASVIGYPPSSRLASKVPLSRRYARSTPSAPRWSQTGCVVAAARLPSSSAQRFSQFAVSCGGFRCALAGEQPAQPAKRDARYARVAVTSSCDAYLSRGSSRVCAALSRSSSCSAIARSADPSESCASSSSSTAESRAPPSS